MQQVLAPSLQAADVIVLDNLAAHKHSPRSKPSTRSLASCHPLQFNPVELALAKLEAFLRAARLRSFDQVCARIGTALMLFTPANATIPSGTAAIGFLQRYEECSNSESPEGLTLQSEGSVTGIRLAKLFSNNAPPPRFLTNYDGKTPQ